MRDDALELEQVEVRRNKNGIVDQVTVIAKDGTRIGLPVTRVAFEQTAGEIGLCAVFLVPDRMRFLEGY